MTKKLIPVEKFMAVAVDNGYEVFEQSQIASYSKDMMLKSQTGALSKEEKDEFAVEMAGLQKAICLGADGKETTLYYRKPLIDWKIDSNGIVMKGIAGVYADVPENRKLNRVGQSYVPSSDVIKAIYRDNDKNNNLEKSEKDDELFERASSIKKSCMAVVADADRRFSAGEIDEELCKAVKSEVSEYLNSWGEVLDECGEVIKSIDHEDVKEDLADATTEFADLVKSAHGKYKDTPENRRLHRVGQEYGKAAQKDDETKKQPSINDELNEAKSKSSDKRTAYYSKLKEIYERIKGSGDSKVNLKKLSEFAESSSPRARMNAYKALQAFEAGATVEEAIHFVDEAYKEYQASMDKVKEKVYSEGISPNMEKHLNDAVWDAYVKTPFLRQDEKELDRLDKERTEKFKLNNYSKLKELYDSAKKDGSKVNLDAIVDKMNHRDILFNLKNYKALQAFEAGATVKEAIDYAEKVGAMAEKELGDVNHKINVAGINPDYVKRRNKEVVDSYKDIPYTKGTPEKERKIKMPEVDAGIKAILNNKPVNKGYLVERLNELIVLCQKAGWKVPDVFNENDIKNLSVDDLRNEFTSLWMNMKDNNKQIDKQEKREADPDKAAEKRARRQERRRERHARKRAEAQAAKEQKDAPLPKVNFSEKDLTSEVSEEFPDAKVKLHNYEAPRTDYYDNDGNLKQSTPFITEFYSDSSQNGIGGYEVYFDKADSIGTFRTKESAIAALNTYANAMRVKGHSKPEWIYNQSKGAYQWNYSLPKASGEQNAK